MVVNFQLSRALELPVGDRFERAWSGWRETATDDELWELNRVRWTLGAQVDNERFATLSFEGRVQTVAEISGRDRYDDGGKMKSTLSGFVLRPGDPVHDALKGRPVPRNRNPVGYFKTPDLDAMSAAERAGFARREPVTMVVTWNPENWNPDGTWADDTYAVQVQTVADGGLLRGQWSTGDRTSEIEPGDRVFMCQDGAPRAIIGSGTTTSRIFGDGNWGDDPADGRAHCVLIDWDTLLLPENGLPLKALVDRTLKDGVRRLPASGSVLAPKVAARLEALWAEHLGLSMPQPRRSTPRQGWQMDPVRRKKVEDAAQGMLMQHFRKDGWAVKDVRFGNPYDAVATKDGRTLWLEAKGTETSGASVIVTRNEVRWARTHPGDCILGILSDVVFLPNGEVDTVSGTFRMFSWNPDGGVLVPRACDFTPDRDDRLL